MGKQFADDSMTPDPISVSRDKYGNEIPSDRPYHGENTPGKGGWAWNEGHYSTDFDAGFGSYGKSVEDKGKSPKSESTSISGGRADRGKES